MTVDPVRIACVGECMVELVEQPDGTLRRGFGGDTLNTAVYLARQGVAVDYVTALGDDPFSDAMVEAWRSEGIGTGLVVRVPGGLPGLYLIQTDAAGERRFSYWRDSAPVRRLLSHPGMARIEAALAGHDVLYLSGITLSLFDAESRARLFGILDAHRGRGGVVAFDANVRPRAWPDRTAAAGVFAAMFARTDRLFLSVEDWAFLTGEAEEGAVRAALTALPVPEIVLKRSERGCLIRVGAGGWTDVPARAVEAVVDTTAAGDSFAAAYLAARAEGRQPAEAAARGHALAAVVIAHRGALVPREAMLTVR